MKKYLTSLSIIFFIYGCGGSSSDSVDIENQTELVVEESRDNSEILNFPNINGISNPTDSLSAK